MNSMLKAIALVLLAVACVGTSTAEEGDNYGYVLGSFVDPDVAFDQDDGWGLQLGLGRELSRWWNIEGHLRATRTEGSRDLDNTALGADFQFVFARGRFQPYLFSGLGFQRTSASGLGTDNDAVFSAGAGFLARIFGDSRASLRGEFRYLEYAAYDLQLEDKLFSVGVQIPFGKETPAPVVPRSIPDSDGDGVNDDRDQCPDTPAGAAVDARGCAVDSDSDGVADHLDQCPNTFRGASVDAKGCELDGDNDGVVDRLDKCPNSAPGVQVDINGCEIKEEIRLPGVNFEPNSDRLLPGAESVLNDAAATLRKNPEIRVEVAGHTDSDGAAAYNESLSTRRALTVRDYLIARGVDEERMSVRGYGESQPVSDNATAAGKASNRRVVLRITDR